MDSADLITQVKDGVAEASQILAENNPQLARDWDLFPDSRHRIAHLYAAKFLLGRDSGTTSLPLSARKVWGAAVNDRQHRDLFPECFVNQ